MPGVAYLAWVPFPRRQALLFRSDEPLVLFLGSNLELQPHQTLEAIDFLSFFVGAANSTAIGLDL